MPLRMLWGFAGQSALGPREPRTAYFLGSDEPKLEIGDVVQIRQGVFGVVLARFIPSGENSNEVHYIVELRSEEE